MVHKELYLIRHGIAVEPEGWPTDETRPLTKEGDRKTRKIAERLLELNLHFNLILTSPLTRAQATAQILQTTGLSPKIEQFAALAPDGNIQEWLDWYQEWHLSGETHLALVGHQPDLANWAEILLWGKTRNTLILKKAGIIGLILPETGSPVDRSQMFWLTPPKYLLPST
ncbi:phosphohistidine phosphatase SixA [Oscillatoriales cyanobacterium USR001]|nr:phosphohistidine phosphatase SixA [Oscillatoriales cyanobacterium USR001]